MNAIIQKIKLILINLLGYRILLFTGDLLVYDRYRWLIKYLPRTRNGEKLLDVGCGSGAFTIAAAARGYHATGISWDTRNQHEAERTASLSSIKDKTDFDVLDIRSLHQHTSYHQTFDVCINFENIEHIINDNKLMIDIYQCLKPGGMLLFSSPNFFLHPISQTDQGPFSTIEDGGHVRRGYTKVMLEELCENAGFRIELISGCSGYFSQRITRIYRFFFGFHPLLAWLVVLPLRIIPVLFDGLFRRFFRYRDYSICMIAMKPRYATSQPSKA